MFIILYTGVIVMLRDDILKYFVENKKQVTLNELALKFGVSRNACWKAINKLGEMGYEFSSDKRNGYTYKSFDKLNYVEINYYSRYFNCIDVFESIDSTNTYLKGLNEVGNMSVVASEEQAAGRGRRGKDFVSKKGMGAYFTFYMQERIDTKDIGFITICVAVAVRRCLFEVYGVETDVKWLNDIYFNNKKLCGILTEATISAEELCVTELFIGVGINTLPIKEISEYATSIKEISGVHVNRNELIGQILNYFKDVFDEFLNEGKKEIILEEYISYQFILGRDVDVEIDGIYYPASVVGINDKAELVVIIDGEERNLNSGTVSLRIGEL